MTSPGAQRLTASKELELILGDRKEFRQIARGVMPWDIRPSFRLFKTDFFDELDSLLKGVESLIQ